MMNTTLTTDPMPFFSQFLQQTLGEYLRPEATTFLEMLADDVVMEFPYTPPGGVRRVEGKEALAEYVGGVAGILNIDSMTLDAMHHDTGSNVVILEFAGKGSGAQTGRPYDQRYISVITLRDGRIAHYRDYWNPLVAIETLGGSDAIAVAVRGS